MERYLTNILLQMASKNLIFTEDLKKVIYIYTRDNNPYIQTLCLSILQHIDKKTTVKNKEEPIDHYFNLFVNSYAIGSLKNND